MEAIEKTPVVDHSTGVAKLKSATINTRFVDSLVGIAMVKIGWRKQETSGARLEFNDIHRIHVYGQIRSQCLEPT